MITEVSNPVSKPMTDDLACEWLTTHGDYLFNVAIGQLRDPHTAEDLVQETFLAALKARDRFAGTSSTRTWLVGILRHKICDHLRRICRERPMDPELVNEVEDAQAMNSSLLWLHESATECNSPSRPIELAEFRDALETALGKLPPRIAQVFQLYHVEEQENRAVCEQLNISESNLWVMLHRARKQLRTELNGWWQADSASSSTEASI
jgi:RNA polymerase sigma-70 factor (TIGR02943 family)